ncbi:polysaccharide biosynthesis tyrosine autokinase [Dictyobacter formicarum]|uniref:Polysaccharide chain length determinant N-terminal domain-containing protein n=1 Tax=Dictyobacter formicarum TaxID=2778368 RepID=A0ABQ3V9E3_9CHLR|nr:polysaccharide biosynthesis tyrosine autokinase [Dictyobacter formicarum]GHO82121.1 hypothetical protein KSZ_01270 [Dictyobacter formicarum]
MSIGTSIGHYGALLRRWLWLLLVAVVLCTLVTYAINSIMQPVYEASALLQVHDISTNNGSIFVDQALAQSDALLINRPDVLQGVARKIHNVSTRQLATQISDSPLDNTPIIQVRVKDNNPVRAATIANTVVAVFIQLQNDSLQQQLKNISARLAKNVKNAKNAVESDQEQLALLQAAHAAPEIIVHQNDTINSDQITYNSSLTSYNQIQQQLLQVPNSLKIVQPAIASTAPVSPNILLNTVAASSLSFVLTLVFILLLDWTNTTIKTVEDVERLARLLALGSVPEVKIAKQRMRDELPLVNNEAIEQAFSTISTNLIMKCTEKRTILVTGVHAKTGTSTTAVNLAITLARTGLRVMLVDGNLQQGALHRVFKHPNIYGLTTVMAESALFQEGPGSKIYTWLHPHKTSIPNLWFLPTGPLPNSRGNILRAPMLSLFIKCLLQPAHEPEEQGHSLMDIIIIDSAPLIESAHTTILAACADASLLVVEAGQEQAAQIQNLARRLQRLQAPLQGIIVNRKKTHHQPYFYVSAPKYEKDWLDDDEYQGKKQWRATAPWARMAISNQKQSSLARPVTSIHYNPPLPQPSTTLDEAPGTGQLLPAIYNKQPANQHKGAVDEKK